MLTVAVLVLAPLFSGAQTREDVEERERELRRQLSRLEDEIGEQQKILDARRLESASLARDVAILDAQIRKAQLQIQARDIEIRQLTGEIGVKQETIGDLTSKLERERASLAQLIRKTNEVDNIALVEVVLGQENLSNVFEDLGAFAAIQSSLRESFYEIENTKDVTQGEKVTLEGRRAKELEFRELQVLEKRRIEEQEAQKQQLLDVSRGIEAQYQVVLSQKELSAAQIRSELFKLRGTAAIPYGDALEFANVASAKTGVRPALILGVVEEESRLGEFLGTGNWRVDMHPTRDQPIFESLMARLGLDPDQMPVSKAPSYGWGGAMGPAQFIPSTWVLYEDRIASATGHKPPNPYDPGDAFMASALLLADNGADRGTRAAERLAALRYFAGWANAENPAYAFYGDEVMQLADKNQNLINQLGGS